MIRCKWCNLNNPKYIEYHDNEWCKPNFDDNYLFEMLILESFQAGLSWECILNKREYFREAFDNFDVNTILAEAKAKGYKYKKSEIGRCQDFQYAFKYKEGYFKVGLLDQAFSIINDGEKAEVYYTGAKGLLFIKTSIGIAGILPFNAMENIEERKTVIEAA